MRSIFLRIFVWFWLAMAVGGLALVISTALTGPAPYAQRVQYVAGDEAGEELRAALDTFERDGPEALRRRLDAIASERGVRPFLFGEGGADLTGGEPPRPVRRFAERTAGEGSGEVVFSGSEMPGLATRIVQSSSGRAYRAVFFIPRERERGFRIEPKTLALRGLVVVLTSGLVCYVLARSLTSPILKVRAAARDLAAGNLEARVGGALAGRRDEIAELGEDFDAMAERVETLMRSQQRLLADISHELRSPLTRLGVALDLARKRDGDVGDLLDRIDLESRRLNEMIGELLDLSRLESGGEIARERVDLAALVEEIADDADFEAQSVDRSVRVTSSEPCVVSGDRDLLRRAVENVTRNALRYTDEATAVEIALSCEGDHAVVRVRDHGPGVPEEDLPNIFRPFYRVGGARERKTGGVGLGLAITERATARHGGSVTASSAPGGGLVVEIRLPHNQSRSR